MERAEFQRLLIKATNDVVAFTRKYVWNPISENVQYHVFPNQSYDKHPDGRILTSYPEDSLAPETFLEFSGSEEVVSYLWREGRVPEWINVQIEEATETLTTIMLICCGRYTDDEKSLYYTRWQMGPFGVKGPALPPNWREEQNEKFDLYWRASLLKNKI